MISVYLLCTVVGSAFVIFTNVLGHAVGGDGHGGGGGPGSGGHGSGHAHGSGGHDGLPLFSPTAIAAYVTGFGSAGLALTRGLGIENPLIHVPISAAFAGVFGVGLLAAMAKLTRHTEGNSLSSLDEIVGQEVEVTVAIPPAGSGEVAFVSGGTRQTATAQSEAGQTFAQGARVRVTRVADGTLHVTLMSALGASPVVSVGEPIPTPPHKDPIR